MEELSDCSGEIPDEDNAQAFKPDEYCEEYKRSALSKRK